MSRCIEILKDDLVDEDWRMGEKHWQWCSERRGWVEEEEEERDDVERHSSSSSVGRMLASRKTAVLLSRARGGDLRAGRRRKQSMITATGNFEWAFGSIYIFPVFLEILTGKIF